MNAAPRSQPRATRTDASTVTGIAESLAAVSERVSYLRAATDAPAADGWIPAADLVGHGPTLAALIATTAPGRGAHDDQVAASLFTQAYAFRVAGVALGAYALGLPVPSTVVPVTAIRMARDRPSAIAYLDAHTGSPEPDRLAAELLGDHLAKFIATVRSEITVGERLLWGNVAASCATALRAIEGESPDERAEVRDRAEAFFRAAGPWLDGLGRFVVVTGREREGWYWERTNCCLWYQASGGQKCDDCSLTEPAERVAGWKRQLDDVPA